MDATVTVGSCMQQQAQCRSKRLTMAHQEVFDGASVVRALQARGLAAVTHAAFMSTLLSRSHSYAAARVVCNQVLLLQMNQSGAVANMLQSDHS